MISIHQQKLNNTDKGFSSNPTLSSFYARSAVAGSQGDNGAGPFTYLPDNTRNAISLAKHFVAYGAGIQNCN